METFNDNVLVKELSVINDQYSSTSFIEIDFIKLFGLVPDEKNKLNDSNLIKKQINPKPFCRTCPY